MLPQFIVIGNLRSGTTWLDNNLREHPEIFLPSKVKGTHFFSHRFDKGIKWYESHFENCQRGKVIGEVSPLYLGNEDAAGNIYSVLPGVKLIACLRDPMSSVWSHYLRQLRQGHTKKIFSEAIKEDPSIYRYHLHYQNLKKYMNYFSKNQLLVVFYDDIQTQPQGLFQTIFQFIGVDTEFKTKNEGKRINPAKYMRFPAIAKLLHNIRWWLRDNKMYGIINMVKKVGLVKLFFGEGAPQNVDFGSEYQALIRDLCYEDIRSLEKLTERNLSHWLKVKS